MTSSTIEQIGTIEKIEDVIVNSTTGFTKKRIHFRPYNGKVFFPEFHYQKIKLLELFKEGDRVKLTFKIWGSGSHKMNNVVADDITHA